MRTSYSVLTQTQTVQYSLLHTQSIRYSLLLLGYKPVQHVTVLNTAGNCNKMVNVTALYCNILLYQTLLGPPSYMCSVVERNVVMRSIPVHGSYVWMTIWTVFGLITVCTSIHSLNIGWSGLSRQSLTRTNQCNVHKENQLDVTFCIFYFSSNSCSTCFGQPCAHHQELTTAWCYSPLLVCAVAAGRLSRPVGRNMLSNY